MSVTGSGTQADPFVVHSYSEFVSLSNNDHSGTATVYIKWFDEPNQVLDCNDYGSEFKWGTFENGTNGGNARYTVDIDLNGATIKNLIVAPDSPMFKTYSRGGETGSLGIINVRNGAIRNIFMGSAASCIADGAVNFYDVSLSVNIAGATVVPFLGLNITSDSIYRVNMDNCALYLVASTLSTSIMTYTNITDTDIELRISDQNQQNMFPYCSFTDCRFQGKISGTPIRTGPYPSYYFTVFGLNTNGSQTGDTVLTDCVVDVDISDMTPNWTGANVDFYVPSNGATLNTNIFCNSHCPEGYSHPSNWNYISHTLMRNGAYLNAQGFTVVEVVEG